MMNKPNLLNTILFDLDGTLLDTEPDFTLILNTLLKQHNKKEIPSSLVRKTVSDGASALLQLAFDKNGNTEYFNDLLDTFLTNYSLQIENSQACLFGGMENLLQKILDENLQWGIITNKSSLFTMPLIDNFPILNTASCVICSDHVDKIKPDPEGLLLACRETSCLPSEAVYIGDHPRDIEAGNNAKMPTIAVKWGYYNQVIPIEKWHASSVAATAEVLQSYLFN